jgi:predicted neutral ceramidase superfamily lipid hydrolase
MALVGSGGTSPVNPIMASSFLSKRSVFALCLSRSLFISLDFLVYVSVSVSLYLTSFITPKLWISCLLLAAGSWQ